MAAIRIIIKANDANQTLINFLKKYYKDESLSRIYHLFYAEKIKINNKRVKNFKHKIYENDVVMLYDNSLKSTKKEINLDPKIPVNIAYEDSNLLIVIKDHGILTHSINLISLDNIVKYYLSKNELLKQSLTFSISHSYRLDKMTKGLVIYPKNKAAQIAITLAQKQHNIIKKYFAVVSGTLELPLSLSGYIYKDDIKKRMFFSKEQVNFSKNCETIFTPIKTFSSFSLIECQLITGRKHQIRASLDFLNLPIVGDCKYGSKVILNNKILLFAYFLNFKNLEEPLSYLNNKKIVISHLKENLISLIKTDLEKKC